MASGFVSAGIEGYGALDVDGEGRKLFLQGEGDGVVLGVPLAMAVFDVVVADVDAGKGGPFRSL